MNLLAAAAIGSIGVLAFLYRRSALFPPVVFAAVWAGALVLLELSSGVFYPISDASRAVFLAGAVAFAAGGAIGYTAAQQKGAAAPRRIDVRRVGWLLDGVIIVLVVAVPVYWQEVQAIAREVAVETVLLAARIRALDPTRAGVSPVIQNLVQLSIFFTFLAFAVDGDGPRWRLRRGVLFGLALAYQLMTGGRSGVAALVVGTVGVSWVRVGRVRLGAVAPAVLAFLLAFAFVAVQLEKGFVRRDLGIRANLPALAGDLQWYAVGGVAGFEHVARDPDGVPSTGGIGRTARELANHLGAGFEIPSLHAQYRTVGDFRDVNVYTAYFAYVPDFGVGGAAFLLGVAGFICAVIFRAARDGSLAGRVLYGIAFVGMCQSVFNEAFYTNLNFFLKSGILLVLVYWLARHARSEGAAAA